LQGDFSDAVNWHCGRKAARKPKAFGFYAVTLMCIKACSSILPGGKIFACKVIFPTPSIGTAVVRPQESQRLSGILSKQNSVCDNYNTFLITNQQFIVLLKHFN